MFENYIKIALRNLYRQKMHSMISMSGLAIGLMCCLLIMLYLRDEHSFDRFHQKVDRIYRIVGEQRVSDEASEFSTSVPGPVAETMAADYPEVVDAAKIYKWFERKLLRSGEAKLYIEDFIYANASFFSVFDFEIVAGDPLSAFNAPNTIVLTESIARKFFGDSAVIDKTLVDENDVQYKIVAVAKDPPQNSHIQFDILVSWTSAQNIGWLNNWWATSAKTYLLLSPGADPAALEQKLPQFIQQYMPNHIDRVSYSLQPLRDVHFHSTHIANDFNWQKGNISYVYAFSAVAVFVLLIACFNFVNFKTARATNRAKEVGLRKVIGADRLRLIRQFLGESLITTFLALLLAFALAEFFRPTFEAMIGRNLKARLLSDTLIGPGVFILTLAIGIAAGSYPALFLSALKSVNVLKGTYSSGPKGAMLRKALVALQFAITVALLIATGIVYQQLEYVNTKELGFQKEQVIIARMSTRELRGKYQPFKNELLEMPEILGVTASNYVMGGGMTSFTIYPEGFPRDGNWNVAAYVIDEDFVSTLGLEIVSGRNLSSEHTTDAAEAILVNETLAKKLGWEAPVGKKIGFNLEGYSDRTIVGVVNDFHFKSLHEEIEPIMLLMYPNWLSYNISIRIAPSNFPATLEFLREKWTAYFPNHPFQYAFLDESFSQLYHRDQKIGQAFSYFALLAIGISCLGLFGLASYTAAQRTREIGIRKVLGASVSIVLMMLTRDFIRPVILANLIAWPVAWYAMNTWLQNFAYRISIEWWLFALAGGMALLIALLTVSTQAIKAALANPVESLRYE